MIVALEWFSLQIKCNQGFKKWQVLYFKLKLVFKPLDHCTYGDNFPLYWCACVSIVESVIYMRSLGPTLAHK